jgi:hypothetical protein
MALKLSIGFQKKVGVADYGSLGANCHVEFEIDPTLLHNDLDGFHEKARHAFVACQQAVNDQLARQSPNGVAKNGNGHVNGQSQSFPTNGGNDNGHSAGKSRPATPSQARAIRAIASRQRLDLQKLLEGRFGVDRPEGLRLSDASALIDELKDASHDAARR